MSNKDEILDECKDKIKALELNLMLYIDESLRKITARVGKLEGFVDTIENGEIVCRFDDKSLRGILNYIDNISNSIDTRLETMESQISINLF
jgi:hypothetical protein